MSVLVMVMRVSLESEVRTLMSIKGRLQGDITRVR
jgi:hypothetical protein